MNNDLKFVDTNAREINLKIINEFEQRIKEIKELKKASLPAANKRSRNKRDAKLPRGHQDIYAFYFVLTGKKSFNHID